ncbi:MAG: hypothetical protein Fur0022_48440 [Anaerolineales bacterium]
MVFCYDQNGNMVRRDPSGGGNNHDFTYDAENRLIEVKYNGTTIATFIYDGDGNRVKATVSGVTTAFIGTHFEWHTDTTNMVKYYAVYPEFYRRAGSQRIAMRQGSADNVNLKWLLGDHLGSTSVTADYDGDLISRTLYKPWGEVRCQSGTLPTAYILRRTQDRLYTGQYSHTADFGLMYYIARWYDPYLNRFIQPDSIVPEPNNPMDWDRYSYTRNNPLKYTDPDGHCPRPPDGWGPAICVALFIEPSRISAGPFTLHGDGRSFSPDSDPGASRGYIWVSPDGTQYEAHMNPSAYIIPASTSGIDAYWYVEPSDKNTWTVTASENGYITIEYDLVISGILDSTGAAPHINGSITFRVNADGSIDYSYDRDGFPWAEAYYYDENGNVHTIFLDPAIRGNPYDLFGIEPNQGVPSQASQLIQGTGLGSPLTSSDDTLCTSGGPC